MAALALKSVGLRKRYVLGADGLSSFLRRANREAVWALDDISFELERGEVLGIVGRNGAGKSTLLKILTRITAPTEGYAEVYGRAGSLLEVGTGFHPELTGRENVFVNGSILGMRQAQIHARFDEIVAFAGVEAFIDTPVKRYSSGMKVRLAFAVAAFLEPQVLFIDEVLAVGDLEFQRRCIGRMSEVARSGRTVVFVSHNMGAVLSLCTKGMLIDQGRMVAFGDVGMVVDDYIRLNRDEGGVNLGERVDRQGGDVCRILDAWIEDRHGNRADVVPSGAAMTVCIRYEWRDKSSAPPSHISVATILEDGSGVRLATLSNHFTGAKLEMHAEGGVWRCRVASFPLVPGEYTFAVHCSAGKMVLDAVNSAICFAVAPSNFLGSGQMPERSGKNGHLLLQQDWENIP